MQQVIPNQLHFCALLSVVSFPLIYKPETLFSFSYKACGFVVCIIFPFTQFVNRLILIFSKLSFLHDSVPAFLHPACAGWSRVGLLAVVALGTGLGAFSSDTKYGLRPPASASALALHPAGRCPNLGSLFPPLAAVVAVADHSIARPIAALRQQGPTPADGPQRNSRPGLPTIFLIRSQNLQKYSV